MLEELKRELKTAVGFDAMTDYDIPPSVTSFGSLLCICPCTGWQKAFNITKLGGALSCVVDSPTLASGLERAGHTLSAGYAIKY